MPATYGSGTASPTWDARAVPYLLWADHAPASGTNTKLFGNVADIIIVLAVDVVSDGGGAGGFARFEEVHSGVDWWAFNIGSSVDTFEWRGYLVIPFQPGVGLTWSNASDTDFDFYISGLLVAGPEGVPI